MMDRLKLDQTGARRGEIFAHSLQLGDDTITVNAIATMAIESETFHPFRTTENQRYLWIFLCTAGIGLILGLVFVAVWASSGAGLLQVSFLLGWGGVIGGLVAAVYAGRYALAMSQVETYHRLRLGASDGRQLDLVDDSKPTLEQLRDTIRTKIDSQDDTIVGTFDLDLDVVSVREAAA